MSCQVFVCLGKWWYVLERKLRNICTAGNSDRKLSHLVNRNVVSLPVDCGGLGLFEKEK